MKVWDFLHNHQVPILNIKVADAALNCIKIHETGRMVCVGSSDGTSSLIQLDDSLATCRFNIGNYYTQYEMEQLCSKLDRTNANDMFDRETRRERILFNRDKAIKVLEKQKAMAQKTREFEKKQAEELLRKKGAPSTSLYCGLVNTVITGCPIKRAEQNFFEHIERVTAERVEREKELRNASLI